MGCPRAAALVAFAVALLGVAPTVLAQLQMSPEFKAEDFCPEAEGRQMDCFVTRLADNDAPPAEPDQRLFPLNGTTFTDCLRLWASERDSPSLSGRYHFRIIFAVDIAHAAEVLQEHGVSYPDPTSTNLSITMRGSGDDAASSDHLGQVTFTSAIDDHGPICISINGSAQTVPSEIDRDTRPDRDHRRPRVVIDMREGSALKFDMPVWLEGLELVGSAQARRTARQATSCPPCHETAAWANRDICGYYPDPGNCIGTYNLKAWYFPIVDQDTQNNECTFYCCTDRADHCTLPPTPSPTNDVTLSPTASPSSSPSNVPTTNSPTTGPTSSPTSSAPTSTPSGAPASSMPSGTPTLSPTTPIPSTATPSVTSVTGDTPSPAVVPSIPSTTHTDDTDGSSGTNAPSGALIGGVLAVLLLLCLGAVVLLRSCRANAERKPSAPYVTPSFGLTGAPIANQVFDQSLFFQNEADLPGNSNNSNNSNSSLNSDQVYTAVDYSVMDGGLASNAIVGPPEREYSDVDYNAMAPDGGACYTTAAPPAEEYTAVDYGAMDGGDGINPPSSAPPRPSDVASAAQHTQYGVWSDVNKYKQPVADEPTDYQQPIAVADDVYATSEVEPSMYLQPVPVHDGSAEYAAPEGDTNMRGPPDDPDGDESTPRAASEGDASMYQQPVPAAVPADDDTAMFEDPYAPAELAAPARDFVETHRRSHSQVDGNADAPVTVQRKRVGFADAAANQVTHQDSGVADLSANQVTYVDEGAMYAQPVAQTRRRPTPQDDGNVDAPVTVQRKRVGFANAPADAPVTVQRKRVGFANAPADAPVTVQRKRVGFADAAANQVTHQDEGAMYAQPVAQTRRRPTPQDDGNVDALVTVQRKRVGFANAPADAPVTVQRKRVGFASVPSEASSSDDDSNLYGEPISFADGSAAQPPVYTETRRRPKKDSDTNNDVNSTTVRDAPVTVQRKRAGVANASAEAATSDDDSNLYGESISFADGSVAQAPVRAETRRMPKMEDNDDDDGVYTIAVGDGVSRLPAPRQTTDWVPAPAQVKRYGETRRRRASGTMESDHDHDHHDHHDHNYEYTRTGVKDPNPPMYAQPPGNSTSPYVMLDMDHIVYRSPRIHQQTRRDVRFDEAGSYNTAGSDATLYNLDYEASVEFQPLTGDRVSRSSMSSKASSQSVHTDYEHYDSFRRSTVDAPSYAQVPGFDDDPSDT